MGAFLVRVNPLAEARRTRQSEDADRETHSACNGGVLADYEKSRNPIEKGRRWQKRCSRFRWRYCGSSWSMCSWTPGRERQPLARSVPVLITSDLRGIESHGIGRLKYYYDRIQAGIQVPCRKDGDREGDRDDSPGRRAPRDGVTPPLTGRCSWPSARHVNTGSGAWRFEDLPAWRIRRLLSTRRQRAWSAWHAVTNARPSMSPTFGVQPVERTPSPSRPLRTWRSRSASTVQPRLRSVARSRSRHQAFRRMGDRRSGA